MVFVVCTSLVRLPDFYRNLCSSIVLLIDIRDWDTILSVLLAFDSVVITISYHNVPQEKQAELHKLNPKLMAHELMALVGKQWGEISDTDKVLYNTILLIIVLCRKYIHTIHSF